MGLASIKSRVQRMERTLRLPLTTSADTGPMIALLTMLAADDGLWREWLTLCAATGLDAAERLAARVNAAMTAGTAAEAPHP